MPEPAGLGGFIEAEWARFWQGWNALSPQEQARLEGARQARQGAQGGTPTINVPGWNDAIHVAPAYQPSRQERQEYQRAMREGRPPLLTPDVVGAIERQNAIGDRIANSAQPGYSQAFGQMMTALDNIQDALSTVATLGRIATHYGLARLALVSPVLAGKVGGYLIPGLGWILGAADLLNLLTWLGVGGLVGYGALCGGLAGGLPPAAVQAAFRGLPGGRPCAGRGAISAVAETNPFAARNLLKNTSKAAKKLPGLGKWFEVAQTTDQLFGRGLSFGAMYGAVMEAAYAAAGATQGIGFRFNVPGLGTGTPWQGPTGGTLDYQTAHGLLARFAPRTARASLGRGVGELRAKWQLARVLMDAPALLASRDALTLQDTAGVLCAWIHALDAVGRDLAGGDVDGLTAAVLELPQLGPCVRVGDGVGAFIQARGLEDTVGRWPIAGAPRAANPVDLGELWSEVLPERLRGILAPIREDVAGMWLGSVVVEATRLSFQVLMQERDPLRTHWAPDFVILTSLMDAGRYPSVAAGEERLWSWWQGLRETVEEDERGSLLPRELDESASDAGVVLLHAEQPFVRDVGIL